MRLSLVCQPGQDHFLGPLVGELGKLDDIEPRVFLVRTGSDMMDAFRWGDAVFVEWCSDPAVDASKMQPAFGKPLVIRLHSYEAFARWPKLVEWQNVARLVFVADHIEQIVRTDFPDVKLPETVVIRNGVDLDKFQPQPWAGLYRIGVVANISGKKNPEMWLQVLAELPERFSMHVAGRMDDRRFAHYLPHMAEKLGVADRFHLDGHVEDIVEWWRDKDFCLSTSPHEGCPLNVIEAAALGKVTVVHDALGADGWPCERFFRPRHAAQLIGREYGWKSDMDTFSLTRNAAQFADLFRRIV